MDEEVLEKNNSFLDQPDLSSFKSLLWNIVKGKRTADNQTPVGPKIAIEFSGMTVDRKDVSQLFVALSSLLNTDQQQVFPNNIVRII